MARVVPFHSLYESDKGTGRRYHTNDACTQAQNMPRAYLRIGSGGYFLCEECARLSQEQAAQANEPAAAGRPGRRI